MMLGTQGPLVWQVFVVDLRQHGQILSGLLTVLEDEVADQRILHVFKQFVRATESSLGSGVASSVLDLLGGQGLSKQVADAEKIGKAVASVISGVASVTPADMRLLLKLVDAMVEHLGNFTLVIDEANIAFNVDSTTSLDDIKRTKAALALFTTFSKQRKQVSVRHDSPGGDERQ
jgi:hypothetical protein